MHRLLPLLLVAFAASPAVAADEAESKRTEGRYYVELSEILLTAEDFGVEVAAVDPGGPASGGDPFVVAAEVDEREPISPRVEIGLNRPGGKTAFHASLLDFDLESRRLREDLSGLENVVTPFLLPPGISFIRPLAESSPTRTGSFPNWANEFTFVRTFDFKMADFTVERNIFENERFRLRWLGGVRFAQLDQGLQTLTTYAPVQIEEVHQLGGGATVRIEQETQDFLTVSSTVTTNAFGPKGGLGARWLFGGEKRWSVDASLDVALLPEKTRATYMLGLFGNKVIPGIDQALLESMALDTRQRSFNATIEQQDFTDTTFQTQGRLALSFRPKSFFTIGVELWQLTWHDLLSQTGVVDTVHEQASYEFIRGEVTADPDLDDNESVIHVPRFSSRDDFTFHGIALNLAFDF